MAALDPHEAFARHQPRLDRAVEACATRGFWSPFNESPSRRYHPPGAHAAGKARFEARLGQTLTLPDHPSTGGWLGGEVSPYTGQALGIRYPEIEVDGLYAAMQAAMPAWIEAGVEARVGLCMELLDRLSRNLFENAYATMHTGGQAFMMAFAGSGANSLDRGLEALAQAYTAMRAIPQEATFERRFGEGPPVVLRKRYRLRPRGVAVVIACGSYPAWNAWPAVLANLATGNPVVLKPHPNGILPMAITVEIGRAMLAEAGFDPNLLTLAADVAEAPITRALLDHGDTAIVDFTGSARFGAFIEQHCRHAQVYTETAGCNGVVVESTDDLPGTLAAIANSLALFSAQMCTAAQNIFVPAAGVRVGDALVSPADFGARLAQTIDAMLAEPSHAAAICGAVQNPSVLRTLDALSDHGAQLGQVLRGWGTYPHPEFPRARTATPLVIALDADSTLYRQEWFGPIGFVITCRDREHALERAAEDAQRHGAIASYAYSTDTGFIAEIEDAFADAGASVGINLIRQRPINYAAAYSDFHVTGLNPAGNACLADAAFVANRFRIVQSKIEVPLAPDEAS